MINIMPIMIPIKNIAMSYVTPKNKHKQKWLNRKTNKTFILTNLFCLVTNNVL